jgi:hypothetical protein
VSQVQHDDEPTRREETPDSASDQPAAPPAEEFETAPWPSQDTADAAEPAAPPAEAEAVASDRPPEAAQIDEPMAPADAAAPAPEPPPSEAEAYPPPVVAAADARPAHSVPATEPGESTECPRCGTENRPGIAFCQNCGQRLVATGGLATVERPSAPEGTQQCPRCGTYNRTGVAFCQNCGAHLRGAAPEAGYVPPATADAAAVPAEAASAARVALLGPIVLLIGAIGIATAWLLPFPFGGGDSLFDRAFGGGGFGIAFWNGYEAISGLSAQAYYGFAAPAPVLAGLLIVLAIAGLVKPAAGLLQFIGLLVALLWAIGLAALFVIVEVAGGVGGDLLSLLRVLTPGGIIFLLASLIAIIGVLTRFARA